jgi:hypothetical protein
LGLGLGLALGWGVGVGLARGDNLDSEVGHASYPLDDVTELLVLGCGPSALEGDLPH